MVQTVHRADVKKPSSKLLETFLPQLELPACDLDNSSDYNLHTSNNYNSNRKKFLVSETLMILRDLPSTLLSITVKALNKLAIFSGDSNWNNKLN